jgi:ATP-binding cassette subfamily B (MDR/TAP) protein 1
VVLDWKLGLVSSASIPLTLLATYLQSKIITGQAISDSASQEEATKIAIETITNIRTVASLGREAQFHLLYMDNLVRPHIVAKRISHLRGAVFGFAQSVPFFVYAGCLYYGGWLVYNEGLNYATVFKVTEMIIMGTMMTGQALAFAPNYSKGLVSAAKIFQLLERKSEIDVTVPTGFKPETDTQGSVQLKNVNFRYPQRRNVKVLRGLNIDILHGQTVALVGSSGCGKSTCIQLLERFYDPLSGDVTLDGHDTRNLNLAWLRSQLGLVSQEPTLFATSIKDNIAYGDNSRTVSMEEIIDASRRANIHNFITSLPQGYETDVGSKGAQLSGGQKQRIAIARALVRKPRILLLDEATSALDNESEKVVQEALDRAREGRTCITIAHRLSTIQNADVIVCIQNGRVVEQGTHAQLLTKKGVYYNLHRKQTT